MKLKKLLDHTENRPLASDVALAIIRHAIPKTLQEKNLKDDSISNIFLQTIYTRQKYTSRALPNEIQETLNTGARYNLCLDAPKLSLEHKMQLLAWHHISTNPGARCCKYSMHARCLRTNHQVVSVGDLIAQESILEDLSHNTNKKKCECNKCKKYINAGCTHH